MVCCHQRIIIGHLIWSLFLLWPMTSLVVVCCLFSSFCSVYHFHQGSCKPDIVTFALSLSYLLLSFSFCLAHSSVFFLSCFLAQRDQCDNDNNHNKFKENWKLFAYDDNPNHLRVHPGRATVMHELLHKFQDRVGYDPSGPRDRTRFEQMKRDPGEYNFLDNSLKMQYIVCSFYSVYCTCKNV